MSEIKGLLLRGSALRAVLLVTNIIVAFFMMPFLVHTLGDRWYGMWTLVATFMGYYGYLDFGLAVSTQRFIAGAIGKRDMDEVNRLVTTSVLLFLGLGAVAFAITLGVVAAAPWFLQDPTEIYVFRVVLLIMGINVAVTFAMAPVNGLMTGHLRFDITTSIHLAKLLLRTAMIVYAIKAGYSIISLAVITLIADVGGNMAKLFVARRMFQGVSVAKHLFSRERLTAIFAYGGKTFVNQIADVLRFQVDHMVIAAFINLSAVTLFNIAGQLVYYLRDLMSALMGVLAPVYARYQAAKDDEAVYRTYYFACKIAAAIAVTIGGAVIVLGKPFIALWMGVAYLDAYNLVVILTIATIVYMMQSPSHGVIYGLGAVGPLARVSIVEAATNLALSLVLVATYGLPGVALGTAVPLVGLSLYLLVAAGRLVGGSVHVYLRRVMPVVIVGAVLQVGTWLIAQYLVLDNFWRLFGWALLLYPLQGLILLLTTFSRDELRFFGTGVRNAMGMR